MGKACFTGTCGRSVNAFYARKVFVSTAERESFNLVAHSHACFSSSEQRIQREGAVPSTGRRLTAAEVRLLISLNRAVFRRNRHLRIILVLQMHSFSFSSALYPQNFASRIIEQPLSSSLLSALGFQPFAALTELLTPKFFQSYIVVDKQANLFRRREQTWL